VIINWTGIYLPMTELRPKNITLKTKQTFVNFFFSMNKVCTNWLFVEADLHRAVCQPSGPSRDRSALSPVSDRPVWRKDTPHQSGRGQYTETVGLIQYWIILFLLWHQATSFHRLEWSATIVLQSFQFISFSTRFSVDVLYQVLVGCLHGHPRWPFLRNLSCLMCPSLTLDDVK